MPRAFSPGNSAAARASSAPRAVPPAPSGTTGTPSAADLPRVIETALEQLREQNERLLAFHEASLGFHRQHHELLGRIVAAVDAHGRAGQGAPPLPPAGSQPGAPDGLRLGVEACLREGRAADLRQLLLPIGLGQLRTLGAEVFAHLIPHLAHWLRDPDQAVAAVFFRMLYEGTKLWGNDVLPAAPRHVVAALLDAISALANAPTPHQQDAADLLAAVRGIAGPPM
eukprot:TRINITY_DN19206_c0_g2_i1.p2 TRINITY_DN19206_c0_g2~~TRINITY_DN19206_c0_g2_i1.p2  ORF type:complete len:226 (+),score=54.72 TRINITY_DN19206_c0_g2_i1:57-734(+)